MDYVSQDSIRLVVIGLVSVAAVSMGAATIESTVELGTPETADGPNVVTAEEEESGSLDLNETGGNGSADLSSGERGAGIVADLQRCIEPLAAWYGGLLYFGALGGVLYGIKRRYSLGASFIGAYAIAPVALTAYFFGTDCTSTLADQDQDGSVADTVGDAAGQGVVSPEVSPVVVAAVFGVALVAVAAVLYRASGDQTVTATEEEPEEAVEEPDVADLAAAAGTAADRLEEHNADVDNEVYRAWWEMTSLLDAPDPETSTPGEFARAAVDLGLAESDVNRLTTVFEEVRYGERDAESREERAIEAFRNIEAAYSEADETGGETDGR